MRTPLLALALALAACGPADRGNAAAARDTMPVSNVMRGPDNLILRIPRAGGEARVFAYPRLDTVVWSGEDAPAPARVLAFDEEGGLVSLVDARGQPARIDFRQGPAGSVTKTKLTGLASNDGSTIYGITADGTVERYGRSGTWKWKPPVAARAVFPQPDASLLVLGERADGSVVWRVRPPSTRVADSVLLPRVDRALRTQVGDFLYLASERELTGVRTRTMQRTASVAFEEPVELLSATPSGDRVFVVTMTGTAVEVVDRYREQVSGSIALGRHPSDLRIDPLGRYLLARLDGVDSISVIALGTNKVVGTVSTAWRSDLPFVAPDGGIALEQGKDVVVVDGETLEPRARVRGGASDFWYPFRWTGFRPRAEELDQPTVVEGPPIDSAAAPVDSAAPATDSAAAPAPPPPAARDTAVRRPATAYTVSFAALLVADKARDLAASIRVGSENARVVTAVRDGSTIYRVVLGPYPTREEAERIGRESKQSYWIYEGGP
ncbi:MAG TPA: SPOR domain-containing protein [Gemmatimonadaceae bacterium]|nr:SPOR domain-containing protein [Gemmatimonadaceae bacterium]